MSGPQVPRRIVGIGYSAGGLEPCMDLVRGLRVGCGFAYVVLPHLSRRHPSGVAEILARTTELTTCRIRHGQLVRADTIYVLPENTWAELKGLTLQLVPRPNSSMNCCITVFLRSLAEQQGARSVGVILSGAAVGEEGRTGIARVKNAGGVTYAQDPRTARFNDMPLQAIRTGRVDHQLSAFDIGRHLARCADL